MFDLRYAVDTAFEIRSIKRKIKLTRTYETTKSMIAPIEAVGTVCMLNIKNKSKPAENSSRRQQEMEVVLA